jgi:hypothetical protein
MDVATGPGPLNSRLNRILSIIKTAWADRRLRLLLGVVAIPTAAGWYWHAAASATLTIAGHHSFRHAEVSVWIDGDLKSTYEVSGSPKKRYAILQKIDGTFSRSLRVGAGDHTVRVRFNSLTDASDITRQCQVNVQAGTESTVFVNADHGVLSLAFAGTAPKLKAADPESSSPYAKTLQSIFLAIAGSALSATVGFVVQDFLKSRKAALASAQAPSPHSWR